MCCDSRFALISTMHARQIAGFLLSKENICVFSLEMSVLFKCSKDSDNYVVL